MDQSSAMRGRAADLRQATVRLVAIGIALIIAACAGPAPTVSPATAATPANPATTASAAPSPTPELRSTTAPASSAPEGAITVEMAGPPGHYVPHALTARAGDVVFLLVNTSQGTHNLSIDRVPLEFAGERVTNVALAASGSVRRGTSAIFAIDELPAGTYFIWCAIDNHAAEGMVGTLTVGP